MLRGSTSTSMQTTSEERFARYTTFILVILVSDFATTFVRLDQKTDLHIYRRLNVLILHLRRSRSTPIRAQVNSVRRSMQDRRARAEPTRHERQCGGDRRCGTP